MDRFSLAVEGRCIESTSGYLNEMVFGRLVLNVLVVSSGFLTRSQLMPFLYGIFTPSIL